MARRFEELRDQDTLVQVSMITKKVYFGDMSLDICPDSCLTLTRERRNGQTTVRWSFELKDKKGNKRATFLEAHDVNQASRTGFTNSKKPIWFALKLEASGMNAIKRRNGPMFAKVQKFHREKKMAKPFLMVFEVDASQMWIWQDRVQTHYASAKLLMGILDNAFANFIVDHYESRRLLPPNRQFDTIQKISPDTLIEIVRGGEERNLIKRIQRILDK
uniref:VID27 domain-containing protein n=1 Tax=Caenorhabditis tropicalis TaxID=1561998 RepID=A0A1I7TJ98_9PELO